MFMSLSTAVDVSSLVFALNHMNARAFAHLYLLGYLWYVLCIVLSFTQRLTGKHREGGREGRREGERK